MLRGLGVDAAAGLARAEVLRRQAQFGPNAVSSHRARVLTVLWHQLRSPLLVLLLVAALASYLLGEQNEAVIIAVIVCGSVGLGFANEYRAERTAESLHARVRRRTVVLRDGCASTVDVTELVPGDMVELHLGDIVPADLRLIEVAGLECDESVLTGESLPAAKNVAPVPPGTALADLLCCALMGTIVRRAAGAGSWSRPVPARSSVPSPPV